MECTQHNQDTESVTTLEIRLPWVTSSAWQTVLSQTPLDFESTKDIYFQLKEQAQDIIGAELTRQIRTFVEDPTITAMVIRNCPRDRDTPPTPYSGVLSPESTPLPAS